MKNAKSNESRFFAALSGLYPMRNARPIVFAPLFLVVIAAVSQACDKNVYHTGKLIDLRTRGSSSCLAIQVDDISYIVTAPWTNTDLIVGDPVTVRIRIGKQGKFWDTSSVMYIKMGKSHIDDEKVPIVRMERVAADKKPATCALPVAVEKP
jgi:hypothetical protein